MIVIIDFIFISVLSKTASNTLKVFKGRPKDYTCSICGQILNSPVRLKCGHRQCGSCLKSSSAGYDYLYTNLFQI
jgi:hypothetical protein